MHEVGREDDAQSPVHGVGFGVELRRRREAAGLSQPALGRMVSYDRTMISKVETGAEPPSAPFAEAVDRALDANGSLAALAPLSRPDDLTVLMPADESTVAWLRDALHGLRKVEHLTPPEPIIAMLRSHLRTIRAVRRIAGEKVRRDLIGLAAEYADTLSGLAQEAADVAGATHWRDRSVEWALQAGGGYREFVIYTNTCRSSLAWWRGHAAGALDAARAVRYAEEPVPFTLRAGGAHYEARALALVGDEHGCMAALEQSTGFAERADHEEVPRFMATLNSFRSGVDFDALSAVCLTGLGYGARAAEIMARGMRASERLGSGRSHHVTLSRLARALEVAGDYEEAATVGMAAIGPAARSGARRTISDLLMLRSRLAAAACTATAVRAFGDQLRARNIG